MVISFSQQQQKTMYIYSGCLPLVAESLPGVGLHFEHKLIAADLENGHLTFKW